MQLTTNQIISARILVLMQRGASLPEAFDAVMKDGAYAKLAGEIYDALRAKAEATA